MLEVRLLGTFGLKYEKRPINISSRPAQSLFAYLILNAGTAYRREKLAGLLWPDSLEETARDNLRHALWRVRKALEAAASTRFLQAEELSINFRANANYWLDAAELKKLNENASAEELIAVLSEYRGELLPGFYEEWVTREREHLYSVFEHHIARLVSLLEEEKRWPEVLEWGERWIKLGQKPETAYRALMIAYAARGDRSKIDATYERCANSLRELGIQPSQQTRVLYERLKAGEEGLPVRSTMVEQSESRRKTNVPVPITSFIGREKEVEEVVQSVKRNRLVTLTGPGGVGKTRLAIQSSNQLVNHFNEGVWWVELAPLSEETLVPQAAAQVLGVRESPDRPLTESVTGFLREKHLLLVLDNCEHLISACAQFSYDLLTRCANLRILTTSREVLKVMGEVEYPVQVLSLPALEHLTLIDLVLEYEGIRLFVERANAKSGFTFTEQNAAAVLQICQRLDGIPLALELAAARTGVLTVEQIAERISERFTLLTQGNRTALPRHQTLRGLIDWSYDLLPEPERVLLRRLSVFVGGWTLQAAEAVCSDNVLQKAQVLELLSRLVDKSLVIVEERNEVARYRMLETIRQYAHEKMLDSEDSGRLYDLHLEFLLKISEEAEPHLLGAEAPAWIDRIQSEWDNIRFAIRWSLKSDRGAKGLRIANVLGYFAYIRGYLRELDEILRELLKSQDNGDRTAALGKGFFWAAGARAELGDFQTAFSLYEKSVEILREAGEEGRGMLETVLALFANALQWSDAPAAARYAQEAVQLCRESGNRDGLANALMRLAEARIWMNDCASARLLLEESAMLAREVDNQFNYAIAIVNLGILSFYEGKLEAAKEYFAKSKSLWLTTSFTIIPPFVNIFLGGIARVEGRQAEAELLLNESILGTRELGYKRFTAWALMHMGRLELDRSNFQMGQSCFHESLMLAREANAWNIVPQLLEGYSYILLALNQPHRAVSLLGAAATSREELGTPLLPIERGDYESCLSALHGQLEQETFDKAWLDGRAMSLERAIEFALESGQ